MLIEMKKVVLFFAVVASVAIFASCGPKQADQTPVTDTTTVVATPAPADSLPADTTVAPVQTPAK